MPENIYRTYRRQFYLGPQPKLIDESWQAYTLSGGAVLSYSADVPVQVIRGHGQSEYVLIGDAVESLPGRPPVQQSLQTLLDSSQLQQVYHSWAGRWVLIADGLLHLDAAGLLGCYYRQTGKHIEVASVAGFLTQSGKPDTFRLIKAGGAEFYPPPDSGFANVSKLLPSQVLNLQTGELIFRNLQAQAPALPYPETIAYLAGLLTTTLKNMYAANPGKKLLLALTGGFDSRALMAALNYCKLPYETLTFHYPNIRPSDVSVPKQLAKISGKVHRLIKRGKRNFSNWEMFNQHTSGHSVEVDRDYMLYQQFNDLANENAILLRGGGFEVGRCAYYPWLPAAQLCGAGVSAIQKGNGVQAQSWNKWLHWLNQTPQVQLDWRDRYYIEQRLAGWLSSTEQALDMVSVERMVPANSTLFYNVMLNLPEHIRKTKVQMTDLIKYLSPELLQVPINPPVNFYYKQYRRVLFKINKIRQALNWT